MKNILGVITARGGSKGIPRKNIKLLGKHPLIAYTINAARESKLLTHTVVSTDDKEISDVVRQFGGNVPFMRPAELATDTAKHVGVVQHAVSFMEKEKGIKYDYVVILQPTSPFRLPEDIDKTLEVLMRSGADSAVSLVEINSNHPLKAKRFVDGSVLPYFPEYPEEEGARRQDLPTAYKRSGAVYAMRRDVIMDKGLLYGKKIAGHIVPEERSIDIDNRKDWAVAEYMLENLLKKGVRFF